MTRVRSLSDGGDWTFGKGRNDYYRNQNAIIQNIATRLRCFLGDCFFDEGAGLNWFNLLGAKDLTAIKLAVSTTILKTNYVTGLVQLLVRVSVTRTVTIQYRVQTTFGPVGGQFTLDTSEI